MERFKAFSVEKFTLDCRSILFLIEFSIILFAGMTTLTENGSQQWSVSKAGI